jgi:RNA polymerase sigma factor (sigma-70 family)
MRQTDPMADDDRDGPPGSSRRDDDRRRDAALVEAARAGDQRAFGTLYDAWFDRVHAVVVRIVRDRDVAEEVCQDAFLSAWRNLAGLQDPASFGGWLLRIARNRAFDRSDREGRSTPVDGEGMAVIESTGSSPTSAPAGFDASSRLARAERPEVAAEDDEIAGLVREATAALAERDAEALDLQLRFELTPAEIGEVMGLNRNAANQLCHRARARFATAFGARILWRGSRPACPRLEAALAAAGVADFGSAAVAIADRHAADCDDCGERRRMRLQPTALFAAMPVLAAPMVLKAKVAGALAAEGVPMQGSAALGSTTAPGTSGNSSAGNSSGGGDGTGSGAGPTAAADPPASDEHAQTKGDGSIARRHRTRSRRVAAGLAIGAVVLVLLGGGVALSARSDDGGQELVAQEEPAAEEEIVVEEVEPAPEVLPGDEPSADEPAVDPGGSSSTTTTQPTTTTAPDPPLVESLTLTPATDKPTAYSMADAPVLTWSVTGADAVEVWLWSDSGSGPQRTRLLSSDPSGSMAICPGTVAATRCSAPPATYLFVVEAENAGGQVVSSDTVPAPRFLVYTVIS